MRVCYDNVGRQTLNAPKASAYFVTQPATLLNFLIILMTEPPHYGLQGPGPQKFWRLRCPGLYLVQAAPNSLIILFGQKRRIWVILLAIDYLE